MSENKEYQSFGNEWRKELMKKKKSEIIEFYKKACQDNQKLHGMVQPTKFAAIAQEMYRFLLDLTKYPESIDPMQFMGLKEEAWKIIKGVE